MDLLSPESGTIFWTVLTFILLLLILKKYAWKPMLKMLEDRENKIKVALYQAEQDQKEAAKLLEEQRALLEKARRDSIELMNETKKSAESTRKELIEHARMEADRILERARHEIDLSKDAAIQEIKQYATEIAILAAQKVVGEALSTEQHLKLIDKYVKEFVQAS
ncbi:MAG: F0F1 ATP synthase subunit B [candidate division KSB1 bacterium]|nr:F0F1 ATP synthase subunit B [candidate division KSB1 bacterium]MDZ7334399.1 F0F1 ATP synthase subunit B [candidate division KSB1 bacterium]MDZ7358172.1 F0F1 ATP synthase subunit B [candidate division KSB1 bacterium]MDZ7398794.1 F0F1 ATP synthase subunit B [candidate division KSB1 bacterium]